MERLQTLVLMVLVLFSNLVARSQTGIKFRDDLKSWQEVINAAKVEGKYVFLDCFTTWCGPCKFMDRQIYVNDTVGNFFNDHFLSVKVQMDRTSSDNEHVKRWYSDAVFIQKNFAISVFPTFLFLAPDGKPLHKFSGALNTQEFIRLAKESFDPKKQYYNAVANFQPGIMNIDEMKGIARALKASGKELSDKIAQDYLSRAPIDSIYTKDGLRFLAEFRDIPVAIKHASNLINSIREDKILTIDTLVFIKHFTKSSADRGFKLFYKHPDRINQVMMSQDYAQAFITSIIAEEEFYEPIGDPKLKTIKSNIVVQGPDWDRIWNKVASKYSKEYATRVLIESQLWWYTVTKDWERYSKVLIHKIDSVYNKRDLADAGVSYDLNSDCWNVFLRATDVHILQKAAKWMEKSFRSYLLGACFNVYMDTYANILYKLGDKKNALIWEERAFLLNPNDEEIAENFRKMKNDEPTWPVKSAQTITAEIP